MLIFFGESDTIKTMKLFDIHKIPDPVLFQKAQEVSMPLSEEKRQLILDMVEYLKISQDDDLAKKYHIRPGVGIAAPQIGISERFYAIYFSYDEKTYEYGLVNPKIISTSIKKAYLESGEGCLSVPQDMPGYVYRYYKVTIKAYDAITQKDVTLKLTGYPAIVFQHEYDHLDGILYIDRINKKDPLAVDPSAIAI